MPISFTTADLLSRVRNLCQLRTDNGKVTATEILAICDEEIQSNLFPALMRVRDDYAVTSQISTFLAGVTNYRLPFGCSSEAITHVDVAEYTATASGYTINRSWQLNRVTVGQLAGYADDTSSVPTAYAIIGDAIEVRPIPTTTTVYAYVLVIHYEGRPSRLIIDTSCRIVSTVVAGTGALTITLTSAIAPTGAGLGSVLDIVPAVPPLGPFVTNTTITSIASDPIITVGISAAGAATSTTQLAAQIVAGSYVTPRGFTCVFPMPEAWWPVLIYAGAAAVCATMGDDGAAVKFTAIAEQRKALVLSMQQNRVRKQPLPAFNRHSPLRVGRGQARGWDSSQ